MIKFLLLTACIFCINVLSIAQHVSVTGRVLDDLKLPLPGATVLLFTSSDSSFVTGTSTQFSGKFVIKYIPHGNYFVKISFIGFSATIKQLTVASNDVDAGETQLVKSTTQLNQIIIKGSVVAVEQKGDTVQYNANAYKTHPDATAEELVTKMPGIAIDNGRIQAGGEDVRRVTIDGKEYFGDDAMIAMRNLPAEIISSIQVFDGQSDQARFTGIMDANTFKVINIVTQNPDAKIRFGRLFSGYGTDSRTNSGGNVNLFNGQHRFTIIGGLNNINQFNFAQEDLLGVTAGGMQRGQGGMGGGQRGQGMGGRPPGVGGGSPFAQQGNDFSVSQQGGINTTYSLGFNYIDKWGEKIKVNGSYFYNQINNETNSFLERNYLNFDSAALHYAEVNGSKGENFNHRFKVRVEYTIDKNNSLIITPKASFQLFNSERKTDAENYLDDGAKLNATDTHASNENDGYNIEGDLLYMHKFKKDGRTFSVNIRNVQNQSASNDFLDYSMYDFDVDAETDARNQLTEIGFNSTTKSVNLNFTETIGKSSKLLFSYSPSVIKSNNERLNKPLDANTGEYDDIDTLLSSSFTSTIRTQKAGLTYQFSSTRTTLNFGLMFQENKLLGDYDFPEIEQTYQKFKSILPTVMLMYKFSSSTNVRIMIRSGNTLPSVMQLQETVDNSNPLQLQIGNSQLKQDNNKTMVLRFASTNLDIGQSFFCFAMLQRTRDYIGTSTIIARNDTLTVDGLELLPNTQLITYENYRNSINARSFFTYALPVKVIRSNLNINAGLGYGQIPGETNGVLNNSVNQNLNLGVVLSSNISANVDFTVSYSMNANKINNSTLDFGNSDYKIHKGGIKFNYITLERLLVNVDASYTQYQGLADNPSPAIVNVAIAYKWLSDKRLETRLSVFDLLKQNLSVSRSLTSNYVEDVYSNVLTQYCLLTVSYKFNKVI